MSRFNIIPYAALVALATRVAADDQPFNLCTEGTCQECPSGSTSAGIGYPTCVTYNSDFVLAPLGFDAVPDGSGYDVYFNINEPAEGCETIVKTPASTDVIGCGTLAGHFKHATCALIAVQETFMVQTCCGDDCDEAITTDTTKRSAKFAPKYLARSGGGGGAHYLTDKDGNKIQPAEEGAPIDVRSMYDPQARAVYERMLREESRAVSEKQASPLSSRGNGCTAGSWTSDEGKDEYTKPAANTEVVWADTVDGGTTGTPVTITSERSSSWTTTIDASVSFEGLFSAGVSSSMTEEESTSQAYQFTVPPGQMGSVGFTPTLTCSTGSADCGGTVSGEVCWPTKDGNGEVVGTWKVVVSS